MTWCIMKRCGVNFDPGSCRYKKCLDLRGIICKIRFHILLMSDKKHQICHCHIDLGISVILYSIQFFVMTVAVSDLDR